MPRHPSSERFHQLLKELGDLHDKKQADYGRENDPFANVRGSTEWGIPAWVGAMIRANDKIKRLQTYAQKGSLANEGVADAFQDLAVYAIIGLVLWEQEFAQLLKDPQEVINQFSQVNPILLGPKSRTESLRGAEPKYCKHGYMAWNCSDCDAEK